MTIYSFQNTDHLDRVRLNDESALMDALGRHQAQEIYYFTLHEIFHEDDKFKQTRSSPNFQGDLVTFATCKHLMRCYREPEDWDSVWLAGFTPKHCADNALFFCGKISETFDSNYALRAHLWKYEGEAFDAKQADLDPRGDLYTPKRELFEAEVYDHNNFHEPPNHTRSLEVYSNGQPKWWRDIEYVAHRRRPPSFILEPAFVFDRPLVKSRIPLGRAVRLRTVHQFMSNLEEAHL